MTSQLRRKHQITARNIQPKARTTKRPWLSGIAKKFPSLHSSLKHLLLSGVLASGTWGASSFADDSLFQSSGSLAPVTTPRAFTPPPDAKPVWLPQRPAANLQAAEQPAEVVTPDAVSGWTSGRATNASATANASVGYDRSQVTSGKPSNAAWQSGLKWRIRNPAEFAASKEVSDSTTWSSNTAFAEHTRSESKYIRQTSQLQQENPFSNPFGDRAAPQAQPATDPQQPPAVQPPGLQPAPGQMPAERSPLEAPNTVPPNQPPAALEPPATPPAQVPMNPPAQNFSEPAPLRSAPPAFRSPEPPVPRPEVLPSRPELFDSPAKRPGVCNRVYNDRDCCDEDQKCVAARRKLKDNPISKISLDITPTYKPDNSNQPATAQRRSEHLGTAPAKKWHNRSGELLASGRMTDFQSGRVVVTQSNGEIKRLPFQDLSDDDLCFVSAWWGLPSECTIGDEAYQSREWIASTVTWKASALCHKPLYFEETQLERYGHTTGPITQPVVSGAHFFLNLAGLPYKMGINPMNECQYPLGYYRPGNCAPWLVPPFPVSLRGALMEAGAVVGGIYIIP